MALVKALLVLVILSSVWTPSRGGDTEVSCVFMESCVLPCSFTPGEEEIIHWIQLIEKNVNVHSYYRKQDQFAYQDQRFRGRTSLFKDQVSRGNASLRLTGVKVQDQGRYKCYTSTKVSNKESFINLKVDAPVRKVHIQQEGNGISCSSEGIYPEPGLTWSTSLGLQDKPTILQTEQLLYNISSSLIPSDSDTDLGYNCTIRTRSNSNSRRATLFKPIYINGSNYETTITCNATTTMHMLKWTFNHSQIILIQTGADPPYTVSEGWRQQVKGVSESGSLTLQHLSSHHEGIYTCEASDAEETLITNTFLRVDRAPVSAASAGIAVGVTLGVIVLILGVAYKYRENIQNFFKSKRKNPDQSGASTSQGNGKAATENTEMLDY